MKRLLLSLLDVIKEQRIKYTPTSPTEVESNQPSRTLNAENFEDKTFHCQSETTEEYPFAEFQIVRIGRKRLPRATAKFKDTLQQ